MADHPWTFSKVGSALPPPPGVTPNYVDPVNHDASTIALHTTLMTVGTAMVGMRVYTRARILRNFGWDDAFCIAGWAWAITTSATLLKDMQEGVGIHLWDIPKTQLPHLGEWIYISSLMSRPAWMFIKLGWLYNYWRVFRPSRLVKWLCIVAGVICFGLYIGQAIHDVFQCIPVQKDWEPSLAGHCLPNGVGGAVTGIFNVISDIFILVLPIPFLLPLQMKAKAKVRLLAVFGVGIFVCVASITRLVITFKVVDDKDLTWKLYTELLWITLEIYFGLCGLCSLVLPRFTETVINTAWQSLRSKLRSSRSRDSGSDHTWGGDPETLKSSTDGDAAMLKVEAMSDDARSSRPSV